MKGHGELYESNATNAHKFDSIRIIRTIRFDSYYSYHIIDFDFYKEYNSAQKRKDEMNFFPNSHAITLPDGNGKKKKNLTAIVAVATNWAIGKGGGLPWNLPNDLANFRRHTIGHIVVPGRVTREAILAQLGHPLKDRQTYVMTRDRRYKVPDTCRAFYDKDYILELSKSQEIFIIGGEQIYKIFLPHVNRLILTHVDTVVEGADAFFPPINGKEWNVRVLEHHLHSHKNEFPFYIAEYTRKLPRH